MDGWMDGRTDGWMGRDEIFFEDGWIGYNFSATFTFQTEAWFFHTTQRLDMHKKTTAWTGKACI